MDITKETIKINKIICEKKEQIVVQGDMIVPDSKPDILNTINTDGNICIYKKEVFEGKLRLEGNIVSYIMYLADGEKNNLRGLNTTLDFSETIVVPELQIGMIVDIEPNIKNFDCKVINGRKIGIKANVEISIKIRLPEEAEITTNVNDVNMQILSKKEKINSLLCEGNNKTYVKENVSIPNTDNLAEILNATISLVDKDIKISYNKILAKSEIELKLVYLTDDGRICKTIGRVPLVGFIDMPDIKEENICDTTYLIKNLIIKPNSIEEHTVYLEVEVEINCISYEEKEIQVIQDLYCPGERVNYDLKTLQTTSDRKTLKNICQIREKVNVPEIGNGEIINTSIQISINKENRLSGKMVLEGEMDVNLIYTDISTIGVNSKTITISFTQTIEGVENNCNTSIKIEVGTQEFINQSGTIDANVDLNFETLTYKNVEIPAINNITEETEDDLEDYSVIIYVVKDGDTLWKIAKKYGSTVDDIVRVNGIENPDKINIGEKIYIPKYVLKRAKEPIVI